MMNTFLIVSSIILINNPIDANKLRAAITKDMPIEDCEGYPPETRFHNFFDISNLTFNRIEEDVIVANGDIIYKGHLFDHDNPTEGKIQIFKYKFGQWMQTPITLFVEDICKTAFEPNATGILAEFFKILEGNKHCPLLAGDKYSVNQHTLFPDCINFKISRIELVGVYKAVITTQINNEGKSALACFQIIYQIQNC